MPYSTCQVPGTTLRQLSGQPGFCFSRASANGQRTLGWANSCRFSSQFVDVGWSHGRNDLLGANLAEERAELAVTQLLGTKLVPSSAEYETDSRSCDALCAMRRARFAP